MSDPNDMFEQPEPAGQFPVDQHNGDLVMIWPQELKRDVATVHGASDAIVCRIVVVNPDGSGEEFENVMLFQRVLISTLTSAIGKPRPVLGRIGQGTAKPGKSAPWVLDPFTEADATLAAKYMNSQFSAPSAPVVATTQVAPAPVVAAPAVEPLAADKKALAENLIASGIPPETVASAAGTSVAHLVALGLLPADTPI